MSSRDKAPENGVALGERRISEIEPTGSWRIERVPKAVITPKVIVLTVGGVLAVVSSWIAQAYSFRVAFVMFLALAGGLMVLWAPHLGVMAYYLLAFLRPQDIFWGLGGARLTFLASISTLGAALISIYRKPDLSLLRSKQAFFVAALWALVHLSTQFGYMGDPDTKWLDYYNKMFLIFFVCFVVLTSEKKVYHLTWVIALSVGYLAGWANEQYFLRGESVVHGPGHAGATLYDHNDFAMLLVMGVPFLWFLMRHVGNPVLRIGLLALIPLTAHGIMVTFSRGGFLGLVAVMSTIAVRERSRLLGFLMIASGVAFFALFAGENYRDRIGSIDDYQADRSASGRLEAWDVGLRMARANPIFGVGLDRFVDAFSHYSNFEPRVAHNSLVQLAAECGFLAVFCYVALIVLTARGLGRIRRRIPALAGEHARLVGSLCGMFEAALVGYLVCGFFLSMEDFEFFYLLVALVAIIDHTSAKRLAVETAERTAAAAAENTSAVAGVAAS